MNKKIKAIVGIDQSYKRSGIAICINGNITYIDSISPQASLCSSEKRKYLTNNIYHNVKQKLIECHLGSQDTIIVFEKIRQFSRGFISMNYIVETGALIAYLVDKFKDDGYECYCIDTRAWKSAVVGTSKPENNKYKINPAKWPTIKYIRTQVDNSLILVPEKKKKKGTIKIKGNYYSVNDDACDAACIAQFYFKSKDPFKLLKTIDF